MCMYMYIHCIIIIIHINVSNHIDEDACIDINIIAMMCIHVNVRVCILF